MLSRSGRKGFSLAEVSMAIAICAFITAGVMTYTTHASVAAKTADAIRQLSDVQQSIRTMYQGSPGYDDLDTSALAASKLVPFRYKRGNELMSPFGKPITLSPGANGPNEFSIQFQGLPSLACQRMSTIDLGGNLAALSVGSLTTSRRSATFAEAIANCASDESGTTVTWTFF